MATDNPQTNSRRSPTPPQQTSRVEDTTPPPHPPLQYDDPERFRDYAHAIDFEDDNFSTDDMFANPTPLPQHEIPSIISAAEQLQQQAQSYPPVRGTGLSKTESRPHKRVRFDTPQLDHEKRRGEAVKESSDGEGDRPQKRARFDMPRADGEKGGVDLVGENSSEEPVRSQRPSEEEMQQQAEHRGDRGDSSDDCAWSLDSGHGGGDEEEGAQNVNAPSEHEWSIARGLEQRRVEAGDPPQKS